MDKYELALLVFDVREDGCIKFKTSSTWTKGAKTPAGYRTFVVNIEGRRHELFVHKLIGHAFLQKTADVVSYAVEDFDLQGCRINKVEYLEWATLTDEKLHSYSRSLIEDTHIIQQLDLKGNLIQEFASLQLAAHAVNLASHSGIKGCCEGYAKTAAEFRWRYKQWTN